MRLPSPSHPARAVVVPGPSNWMSEAVAGKPQPLPDRKHPHRLDPMMYRAPDKPVFITVRSRWHQTLSGPQTADTIVSVMTRMAANRGIRIHAYCIMPDHVHVVISPWSECADLGKWVRYTKRAVQEALGANDIWERSYWDRHARQEDDVVTAVAYTLHNPVRAGLCERWQDWPFSWSQWHEEARGVDPNR